MILEFVDMEAREEEGLDRAKTESMNRILIYLARTYQDMNLYLKGLYLTLDSWRLFRDKEGWRIQGEKLNISDTDVKWEKVREGYKPLQVKGLPRQTRDTDVLKNLTEG